MNVYIESNFVLEQALEQEIILLASSGELKLVIPALSLAEPHQAIFSKAKIRSRLSDDLRTHLNELARSKPHRGIPETFDALTTALVASAQFEREGLRQAVAEILRTAEVIPLDAAVLISSAEMEVSYGLSGQDAIVLASVLSHLESKQPEPSCFLTRNSKDFDDPDIRERLETLNCKFFSRFGTALSYLTAGKK